MNHIQKYFLYKKLMRNGPAAGVKYTYTDPAVTEMEWTCKRKRRPYVIRSFKLKLKHYDSYMTVVLMSRNTHDVVACYDDNSMAQKLFERVAAVMQGKSR